MNGVMGRAGQGRACSLQRHASRLLMVPRQPQTHGGLWLFCSLLPPQPGEAWLSYLLFHFSIKRVES